MSDFSNSGCLIDEMHDQSDAQLLRDFAEHGTEAAFAEIVTRHADLVYSAALRQVNSPDLARDVAQSVFTDLARKAREVSFKLAPEASLVGWLYRGTRFAARDLNRTEIRRTQRERQAMEQVHPTPETPPDWEQLRPALDDAMAELDEADRDALLLRYFKNHDLRTVGATLGISDDAAQKRVSRAVERLREFFAKRGVTIGASGIIATVSANAVQAAPVGLALTISTAAALTGTTLVTTATATATKAIAMTALQKTIVTATIAVLAGAGIYEARQASLLREQVRILQQQQAPLTEQITALNQSLTNTTNQLAALRDDNVRLNRNTGELLKLRGEISRLRQEHFIPTGVRNAGQTPANGFLAKDRLISSRFDTPEAGLQSFMKAFSSGSYDEAMAAASPEIMAFQKRRFDELSDEDKKVYAEEAGRFQGMQIIAKKIISDDKVEFEVLMFENGRAPYLEIRGMRKIGNDWKFNDATKMVESWGNDGEIQLLTSSGN